MPVSSCPECGSTAHTTGKGTVDGEDVTSGNARTANMSGRTQSYNSKRAQCAVLPTGDGRNLDNEPRCVQQPPFSVERVGLLRSFLTDAITATSDILAVRAHLRFVDRIRREYTNVDLRDMAAAVLAFRHTSSSQTIDHRLSDGDDTND